MKPEELLKRSFEEYKASEYDSYQLYQIELGIKYGLSDEQMNKYANKNFNYRQMEQIRKGLEKGLDVSQYADLKFDAEQMNALRIGLGNGRDVSIYANSELSEDKMFILLNALQYPIHKDIVKKIANPEYTVSEMLLFRSCYERGINILENIKEDTFFHKFQAKQIEQMNYGIQDGLTLKQILVYADESYDPEQMEQIRKGLEKDVDVSQYLNPDISCSDMEKMRSLLEYGTDIKALSNDGFDLGQMYILNKAKNEDRIGKEFINILKNKEFSQSQMDEIRIGLSRYDSRDCHDLYAKADLSAEQIREVVTGLTDSLNYKSLTRQEVEIFANPKYSPAQMKQIKTGLYYDLDVTAYLDESYTASQMEQIRKGLKSNIDVSLYQNPKISATQMKNIRKCIEDGTYTNTTIDTNKLPFKSVEEIINENMPYGSECKENDNPLYDDLIR